MTDFHIKIAINELETKLVELSKKFKKHDQMFAEWERNKRIEKRKNNIFEEEL